MLKYSKIGLLTLFVFIMDYVISKSEKQFGFIIHPNQSSGRNPEKQSNNPNYADDIALPGIQDQLK